MISNRFFVSALDDGTTLHGNLSVNGSLSQAWNGSAAVPDWHTTEQNRGTPDQPTIMLTLLSGATYIGTSSSSPNGYISEQHWYYNDNGADSEIGFEIASTTITWDGGGSVTGHKSTDGKFLMHESTINGVSVPCLRLIQNLASSSNVDLDTITFKGKYNSGSGELDFQASAQIRISLMSSGGYLGVISFANGISDITSQSQTITMTGTLYGSVGTSVSCKTEWRKNGEVFRSLNTNNTVSVTGADIVDNAVIQCDFYITNDGSDSLVATAYANIDDMQDPEMMYIQYNGANGNAASLRKGQSATFDIWIGTNDNPTVDTTYAYFQVKLVDGSGNVITASYSSEGIPDVVSGSGGWRNLTVDSTTFKARLALPYDVVNANGKNITGLLRASTSAFTV